MTKSKTRFLTAGLAMIVLLAAALFTIPATGASASAADAPKVWDGTIAAAFAGGTGTESDPYQIADGSQLALLAQDVNSDSASLYKDAYIKLTSDIDLGNTAWTPIGGATVSFNGNFDGGGHTVSIANVSADTLAGLFGSNSGTITKLSVKGTVSGKGGTGGISGFNSGTISMCMFQGSVQGTAYVGGITGKNEQYAYVINCFTSAEVTGEVNVGGICGYNDVGYVNKCVSVGTVSGTNSDSTGSVCGYSRGSSGNLSNCIFDNEKSSVVGSNGSESYYASGQTTEWLSGSSLAAGLDYSEWNAGSTSVTPDGDDSRFGTKTTFYFSLKGVGEPVSTGKDTAVYNFGYDGRTDWQEFTLIETPEAFAEIGTDSANWTENYVLAGDLDLSGQTLSKIGVYYQNNAAQSTAFTGKFSGDGHCLENVLIDDTGDCASLFANNSGLIMNLSVKGKVNGHFFIGGICAYNGSGGMIYGCTFEGKAGGSSNDSIGGICGENHGRIKNCYSSGDVDGYNNVGGVAGYNSGSVTVCYNTGTVSGAAYVGGVCGGNGSAGTVSDCFNAGKVPGRKYVGGVVGNNSGNITSCYSTGEVSGTMGDVGGVVGLSTRNTKNCYYNSDVFTQTGNNNGIFGLTSAKLCDSLPSGFSSSVWEKGFITPGEGDTFRTVTYTFPSLKGVGEAYSMDREQYNFSYNGTDNWAEFTLIKNADEFKSFAANKSAWSKSFVLGADIDLGGESMTPIGTDGANGTPFSGNFSGEGHSIKNVNISVDGSDPAGLFGYSKGIIRKLYIESGSVTGYGNAGGVCGSNSGYILECGNSASVTSLSGQAGGITGCNYADVSDCFNTGSVKGNTRAGGIAANGSGKIQHCYNAGTVDSGNAGGICSDEYTGDVLDSWYNSDITPENNFGTGISTPDMTSADALTRMGLSSGTWTKKPNNTADCTAYYPAFSLENAPSVKYTPALEFKQYGNETPVYGGDIRFTAKALVDFGDYSVEDSSGVFSIMLGDKTVVPGSGFTGNTAVWTADTAGTTTLTLVYTGGNADFFPGEITEDLTLDIEKKELTAADLEFIVPADLGYNGGRKIAAFRPGTGITGVGEISVNYFSDGNALDSAPINAGSYTVTADVAEGKFYKAAEGLSLTDWEFTITKAEAPVIADNQVYYSWSASGERSVPAAGLPGDTGTVGAASASVTGDDIIAADSVRYSGGEVFFTFNPDKSAGQSAAITLTLPTQNYDDITFRIVITLNEKSDQEAPKTGDFGLVFTGGGSGLTAEIVTSLSGVEFSFDGVNWSDVNSTAVEHEALVTGYVRFAETDELNASGENSVSARSGHGTLTHHARVEPDCQKEGSIEYWECEVCGKYFLDENGSSETSLEAVALGKTNHRESAPVRENVVTAACTVDGSYDEIVYCSVCSELISTRHVTVPAAGHKWAAKYESDKNGHWHKCEVCSAASDVEKHVSSDAATTARAETCTVCGYEISPKKSGGNSGGSSGGHSYRPSTPEESKPDNPSINGSQKSWSDIAADLSKQNGGSVVISMNGETTVPAEVIKAIADRRIKAEFVIDSTKSWIIDGAKVSAVKSADLSSVPGSADKTALRGVTRVDIRIPGTGVPAELKLSFRREFAGQFANVYRLTDGVLKFQGCAKVGEDGSAIISGADASGEYVVMACEFSDLPGDVNNDGVLNALDAAAVLKQVVGISGGANPLMGDFNGDGAVNALDAAAILKKVIAE